MADNRASKFFNSEVLDEDCVCLLPGIKKMSYKDSLGQCMFRGNGEIKSLPTIYSNIRGKKKISMCLPAILPDCGDRSNKSSASQYAESSFNKITADDKQLIKPEYLPGSDGVQEPCSVKQSKKQYYDLKQIQSSFGVPVFREKIIEKRKSRNKNLIIRPSTQNAEQLEFEDGTYETISPCSIKVSCSSPPKTRVELMELNDKSRRHNGLFWYRREEKNEIEVKFPTLTEKRNTLSRF